MTQKNERNILFLDFHLTTKTSTPKIRGLPLQFTISEIFSHLNELRESNDVNVIRGRTGEPKEIYLADIREDLTNKCWYLLINITDTSLADEVHREIGGTDQTRTINSKGQGVGTDFSSHIIINTEPETNGSYIVLYEQNSALPVKDITSYLNEIFKRMAKRSPKIYELPHPKNSLDNKGKIKKIKTYLHCFFSGHLSTEFKSDLDNGNFKEIKLITGKVDSIRGYDSQKHSLLKEILLPIKIDKGQILKAGGNHNWIDFLRKNIAKDLEMQEIKVSFKDDNDVSHTADIDTKTGSLINSEQYVKKNKITGFHEPLTTSVDLLHKPLIEKMLELLKL